MLVSGRVNGRKISNHSLNRKSPLKISWGTQKEIHLNQPLVFRGELLVLGRVCQTGMMWIWWKLWLVALDISKDSIKMISLSWVIHVVGKSISFLAPIIAALSFHLVFYHSPPKKNTLWEMGANQDIQGYCAISLPSFTGSASHPGCNRHHQDYPPEV